MPISADDLEIMRSGKDHVDRRFVVATRFILLSATVVTIGVDDESGAIIYLEFNADFDSGLYDPDNNITWGQTLEIGTTEFGSDIGVVRVRNGTGATLRIPIAAISPADFPVELGHFITVREEYRPWQRQARLTPIFTGDDITDYNSYHDYDEVYINQNLVKAPKVNICEGVRIDGSFIPYRPVGYKDNGTGYRDVKLSAINTKLMNSGDVITGYFWLFTGLFLVGTYTDRDIIIQIPVGMQYIFLSVSTENDDGFAQGYLRFPLWALDDDYNAITDLNISSDKTDIWRQMQMMFFGADLQFTADVIPQLSLGCYWEDPSFRLGKPSYEESYYRFYFLCWSMSETSLLKITDSRVTLNLAGAAYWYDKFDSQAQTLTDFGHTPETWHDVRFPTINSVLHYIISGYSTMYYTQNVEYPAEDSGVGITISITKASVWAQIAQYAKWNGFSDVKSDSWSNVIIKKKYSMLLAAARLLIEPLFQMYGSDWNNSSGLELPIDYIKRVGSVSGGGNIPDYGEAEPQPILFAARAPGKVVSSYGVGIETAPFQWLPADLPQWTLNWLLAHYWEYVNNPQASVTFNIIGNLDCIEPALGIPVSVTWLEETVRGTLLQSALFLPKSINTTHNDGTKVLTMVAERVTEAKKPGQAVEVLQEGDVEQPIEIPPGILRPSLVRGTKAIGGLTTARHAIFIYDIDTVSPTTVDIDMSSDITETIRHSVSSPWSPYYLGLGQSVDVYCITIGGDIYKITDIQGVKTVDLQFTAPPGASGIYIQYERGTQNYLVAAYLLGGGTLHLVVSEDGETWIDHSYSGLGGITIGNFVLSPHTSHIYIAPEGLTSILRESSDKGVSIHSLSEPHTQPITELIHIPYQSIDDKIVYSLSNTSVLVKCDNAMSTIITPSFGGYPVISLSFDSFKTYDLNKNILIAIGEGSGIGSGALALVCLSINEGSSWTRYNVSNIHAKIRHCAIAGDNPDVWYTWGDHHFGFKDMGDSTIQERGTFTGILDNIWGIPNTP